MIKVLFFAQTREQLGVDSVQINADNISADQLRQQLAQQDDHWAKVMQSSQLLVAVNQDMVPMHTVIRAGDEVAFFPPVTGG